MEVNKAGPNLTINMLDKIYPKEKNQSSSEVNIHGYSLFTNGKPNLFETFKQHKTCYYMNKFLCHQKKMKIFLCNISKKICPCTHDHYKLSNIVMNCLFPYSYIH